MEEKSVEESLQRPNFRAGALDLRPTADDVRQERPSVTGRVHQLRTLHLPGHHQHLPHDTRHPWRRRLQQLSTTSWWIVKWRVARSPTSRTDCPTLHLEPTA